MSWCILFSIFQPRPLLSHRQTRRAPSFPSLSSWGSFLLSLSLHIIPPFNNSPIPLHSLSLNTQRLGISLASCFTRAGHVFGLPYLNCRSLVWTGRSPSSRILTHHHHHQPPVPLSSHCCLLHCPNSNAFNPIFRLPLLLQSWKEKNKPRCESKPSQIIPTSSSPSDTTPVCPYRTNYISARQ